MKMIECPTCGGSGEVEYQETCSYCEGYGRVAAMNPETGDLDVEGYSEICPRCGGAGCYPVRQICPLCRGTGEIEEPPSIPILQ